MEAAISQEILEAICRFPIFAQIEKERILELFSQPVFKAFRAGETIFNESDASDGTAYIIVEGAASVWIGGSFVKNLETGTLFWEYGLISEEARTATIKAETNLACLLLQQETMFSLLSEDGAINDLMISRIKENFSHNRAGFED